MTHRILRFTSLLVITCLLLTQTLFITQSEASTVWAQDNTSVVSTIAKISISNTPNIQHKTFLPVLWRGSRATYTEVTDARTPNLRVYTKTNQGKQEILYQYALDAYSYQDPQTGTWHDIDPRIVLDSATGMYQNAAASFNVAFPSVNSLAKFNNNPIPVMTMKSPYDSNITFTADHLNLTQPEVDENVITYKDVTPGQDLRYTIEAQGVKEELILLDNNAASSISFEMSSGLTPQRNGTGGWNLVDDRQTVHLMIPKPFGTDVNGEPAPIDLSFEHLADSVYRYTLAVDQTWLDAPKRAFPVVLDPSIVLPSYVSSETYVEAEPASAIVFKTRNRLVGKSVVSYAEGALPKGVTRIYTPINLDFLPDYVTGADIQSVSLVFTQYASETSLAPQFEASVYPIVGPWEPTQLNWTNQPAVESTSISSSVVGSAIQGQKRWDITEWSKQVLNNTITNNGLMIRATDENQGAAVFRSSHCTDCPASSRPFIEVLVQENLLFGDGSDGDLIIPAGETHELQAPAVDMSANWSTLTTTDNAGFSVGDLILLYQIRSVSVPGHYEFNRIKSFSSPTTWELENPVSFEYRNISGKAQVIRVPQYRNVQLGQNARLVPPAWDGTTGGVLVFKANGTVTLEDGATISANEVGLRGGAGGIGSTDATLRHGYQGEQLMMGEPTQSKDALASSGGGGRTDELSSDGGGGGGGAAHKTEGQDGTIDNIHRGQDYGRGSTWARGDADLVDVMMFGGAGGGGAADDAVETTGGKGGNGGGVVLMYASQLNLTPSSVIESHGEAGEDGTLSASKDGSGGGGGGAGGSVRVVVDTATISGIAALGGAGGKNHRQSGDGGAGGNGMIQVEYCTSLNDDITTTPQAKIININCAGLSGDSGLNVLLDTWNFPNQGGLPSFAEFVEEYGLPNVTYIVSTTLVQQLISDTTGITRTDPITSSNGLMATTGITSTDPVTPTEPLTPTDPLTTELNLGIVNDSTGISLTIPLTYTDELTTTEDPEVTIIPKPIQYLYEEIVYKAVYQDEYVQAYNAAIKGGLCAGMIVTAAALYLNVESITAYGGTDSVRSIPKTEQVLEFIRKFHGRQVSAPVMRWRATYSRQTVTQYYNYLLANINTPQWQANPDIVGIITGLNCDESDIQLGHALLPYRVEPQPGNTGRIYVYDPNYVDMTPNAHYIEVDLNNNTWRYTLAAAEGSNPEIVWSGTALDITPFNVYTLEPELPTDADEILAVDGVNYRSNFGTDIKPGHAHNNVSTEDGTHAGCIQNGSTLQFVEEISRTVKLTPLSGFSEQSLFPNAFFMPADRPWTFEGLGSRSGNTGSLLMFGPAALVGALGPAYENTVDSIQVDEALHSLTFATNDADKQMSLFQMHELAQETRIFGLSNMMVDQHQLLTMTVSLDAERVEVINTSALTKELELGFTLIGQHRLGQKIVPALLVGNSRMIFTPVWEDLQRGPVVVEVDLGIDGTIDHVYLLDGQTFPVITASTDVPAVKGTTFAILTHEHTAPGQIGWINLDYRLKPNQVPTNSMKGNHTTLRRWLASEESPVLWNNGGVPGIPGTHGGLFEAIGTETSGSEGLYHVGEIVLIPTYDQVINPRGGAPTYYHINGFALVEIISSTNSGTDQCTEAACWKEIIGKLVMKVAN